MKNNDIQSLLERYREGTLSDNELAELNRLTHRDEVMSTAEHRANNIIRRRRSIIFSMAGILLAGAAVWTLLPRQEESLVAETTVSEKIVALPEPTVEQATPAEQPITPVAPRQAQPRRFNADIHTTTPSHALPTPKAIKPIDEEPVVVCNNQCEADSVISDIWKFLTV